MVPLLPHITWSRVGLRCRECDFRWGDRGDLLEGWTKPTPDVARASGKSTVRDEAQTRQGAILDAYFSVPAALRSRIELAPKG